MTDLNVDDRSNPSMMYENYRRLKTAIESAYDTIVITDVDGTILYVNPAFEKNSGYSREEAVGSNPRLLKSGKHDKGFYEDLWNTILSGNVWHGEFVNKRKDGSLYYDRASISPVSDDHGQIISFVSVRQNVTESRIAEENLKISKQRNSAILNTVGEGVVVIGVDSNIRFINHEVTNIFGYEEDELIGRSIRMLMPEEYRAIHEAGMKRYLEGGAPKILGKRIEIEALRKDGARFPIELRIEETNIEASGDHFFTAAIRDISKRKHAEQSLREHAKKLKELDAFKDKMFSIISHDLRSPLTSDIGLVNLLLDEEKESLTARQRKILETLKNSVKYQFKMVEDLIDISRLQRGALDIRPEPVPASEILKESVSMLRQMAIDKGVDIAEQWDDSLWLEVDKEKMIHVLNNLLSNAIKFTEPGGKVALLTKTEGEEAEIIVRDTGVGIDPDRLEKVFDLSEKVSTFGTAGEKGTGLGLSICQEITVLNKGELAIESEPGKGSTVRLKFKCWKAPE